MVPSACKRMFACVLGKAGQAKTFGERHIVRIGHDFGNHVNVRRASDWRGRWIIDQQAQDDSAHEYDLVQKRRQFTGRILQERQIWISH